MQPHITSYHLALVQRNLLLKKKRVEKGKFIIFSQGGRHVDDFSEMTKIGTYLLGHPAIGA